MGRITPFGLLVVLMACDDASRSDRCAGDEDCPWGDRCTDGACRPGDLCGAGIYAGDQVPQPVEIPGKFPRDPVFRPVAGDPAGLTAAGGTLTTTGVQRFELDFFDEPAKDLGRTQPLGFFLEARLRIAALDGPCTATLSLWPDRHHHLQLCLGDGGVGPAGRDLNTLETVDLAAFHTWRIEVHPRFSTGTGAFPQVDVHLDGVRVLAFGYWDFLPVERAAERAPLVGFGAEGGTVEWDFVRWGCNPAGGPCPGALQGDDSGCATEQVQTRCSRAAAPERCNGQDDDCDGAADEDFRADFDGNSGTSISILGVDRFLGEPCGLTGPCSAAIVACDGEGLVCDVADLRRPERCDGLDNDCDARVDEDFQVGGDRLFSDPVTGEVDLGLGSACGLGACAGGEVICAGAAEELTCSSHFLRAADDRCDDDLDNDCDGQTDEGADADGDGFQACPRCREAGEVCIRGHDCDDSPETGAALHPGAPEICNRIDDDCDFRIDEGLDADGDGFLPCGEGDLDQPPRNADCDDDPTDDAPGRPRARDIDPFAVELCDAIDNDCDDRIDEDFSFADAGGRRYYTVREHCGACGVDCTAISWEHNTVLRCEIIHNESPIDQYGCAPRCLLGFVDANRDIRPEERLWHQDSDGCECEPDETTACDDPGADGCTERCDGRDNDCDGELDEAENLRLPTCYTGPPATRNVGICHDGRLLCLGGQIDPELCRGEQRPLAPVELLCDGLDEDCDGAVDESDFPICDP